MLPNGNRVKADAIVVATRPQFTSAGRAEKLPVAMETHLEFSGIRWRAEFVVEDEAHITLYCCKNP